MNLQGNYFNGEFHEISGSSSFEKHSPADNKLLWKSNFSENHIADIITSASHGFHVMSSLSLDERVNLLKSYKQEVLKRLDDIAIAIALEVGKPLWEARTEANAIAGKVDVTINDSLKRIVDKKIENVLPGLTGHEIHKPLGVSLVIGPFNFPCHLANGQMLSLLISGNSVIFKPSEKTIYSAQILIECFHAAGFPKGSVNFIVGDGKIASELVKHSKVKGIFFTGSKAVGQKILENTYKDLSKMVALELGGKNSSIVHDDASIDHSIIEILKAAFLTTGQRCTSTGNIFVHKNIINEFSEKFSSLAMKMHVDHPIEFESLPFMSSLIDQGALETFDQYVKKVEDQGGKNLIPDFKLNSNLNGAYATPSIHLLESSDTRKFPIIGEEVFGPHCAIIAYDDIDEAISASNFTEFGLAGSVFTNSPEIHKKCLNEVQVGIFNLNRSTVGASSKLPFGGIKNSGNYHPAAVSMIDSCVYKVSSLETYACNSTLGNLTGIK